MRLTRTTRAAVLEVLRADHARTARAKGLTERVVIWKHVLGNALLTIVTAKDANILTASLRAVVSAVNRSLAG